MVHFIHFFLFNVILGRMEAAAYENPHRFGRVALADLRVLLVGSEHIVLIDQQIIYFYFQNIIALPYPVTFFPPYPILL